MGNLSNSTQSVQALHARVTDVGLQEQLTRFWQVEEVFDASKNLTCEESLCEKHFQANVSQTCEGRYVVKLPTREHLIDKLGDSRDVALKRLHGLEKRLKRDPELKSQYTQFLNEYRTLGHMRAIAEQSVDDLDTYYMPHHCVFKQSENVSKIRVVFDASSRSGTGISLNDALLVGPTVQQDLMTIMLRFRTYNVLVADIIKMYRQILVHPSQTRLQRILWRGDPDSEVQAYELTTVAYGTASASYLATRCLRHLADQHSTKFPVGSVRVKLDFYVDDLLTGADSLSDARRIRDEIIDLLKLGAFQLSKLASNCTELLPDASRCGDDVVTISDPSSSSILGVHWDQSRDTFHFSYACDKIPSHDFVLKHLILSEISRLFDPLGLLGPVIVVAKLLLQELWQSSVD